MPSFLDQPGLSHFKNKLDIALDAPTLVRNRGTVLVPSQLPRDAAAGDFYYVEESGSFYLYDGTVWRTINALRQADVVSSMPSDPVELAVLASTLAEGAHISSLT